MTFYNGFSLLDIVKLLCKNIDNGGVYMNKLKVLFCLLLLAIAANLTIYVKATDEVPDNGAKITSAQIIQTKTGTQIFIATLFTIAQR